MPASRSAFLGLVAACVACGHNGGGATAAPPSQGGSAPEGAPAAPTTGITGTGGHAEIGQPAPDFTLPDTEGHPFHLADARGKTVVLEWFNPGCPFVRVSHTKGSLRDAAKRHAVEGVVWVGVNSAGPGKQGYGADATREAKSRYGLDHPILLDESGDVGHVFGATNTPHIFVIDRSGTLVYRGAVDNSPDGEGESPTDGKLVSYVDATLAELAAGRAVAIPSTKAYGCSVKYARP